MNTLKLVLFINPMSHNRPMSVVGILEVSPKTASLFSGKLRMSIWKADPNVRRSVFMP